jgi:hypothetical protein
MKIRLSYLAPVALAKRIKTCLKNAGFEFEEKSVYGEIWSGTQEHVLFDVKRLNDIFRVMLYVEVIS